MLNKPIWSTEELILPQSQNTSKKASKVSFSDSRPHTKIIPVPQTRSREDSKPKTVNRGNIWKVRREIPPYTDPMYRSPPKPVEIPLQEILRKLMDLDTDINTDFEENSLNQEVVISETYQRPNRPHF